MQRGARVDSHVHAFPDRLALAVRDALNRRGGLDAGPLLPQVAESVLEQGFDAAWILPYAHRAGVAASANEWSAEACARYPWLIAGATFHPDDEDLERLVQVAFERLALRVVKLHCSVGNFGADDYRLKPLWEGAEQQGVPVVIHAGRQGGTTGAEELDGIVPVLASHPQLKLVLAHAGHPQAGRTLDLMARFPNLYADLTPVWESAVEIGAGALTGFAGRFLFGSDAPNNPVSARDQAARFERMGLTPPVLEELLGGAATTLIALSAGAQETRRA